MKRLALFLSFCVAAIGAWAQQIKYANDATLVSNDGTDIVIEVTGVGANEKMAKADASKKVLNTLVLKGIDGLDNHTPLCGAAPQPLKSRINTDTYFPRFIDVEEMVILEKEKTANGRKLKLQMTVHYESLKEDVLKNSGQTKVTQGPVGRNQLPTLTVVPYTKEGEDAIALLDSDPWMSYAVTNLGSAFGDYGYKVKDYKQLAKMAARTQAMTANSKSDFASNDIANRSTDIEVTVRPTFTKNSANQTSVSLEMKATETLSGSTLSQQTFSTRFLNNKTPQMLVDEAIGMAKRQFFKKLEGEFFEMVENGREMVITLTIDQNADWDFDQDTPSGDDFQDALGAWMDEHTKSHDLLDHVSTYIIQGSAYVKMWDYEKGKVYRLGDFSRDLKKFLKASMSGEYDIQTTVSGQDLKVTIK